eukprot:scaffold216_cov375-Pavlova_lutheri.AAC.5
MGNDAQGSNLYVRAVVWMRNRAGLPKDGLPGGKGHRNHVSMAKLMPEGKSIPPINDTPSAGQRTSRENHGRKGMFGFLHTSQSEKLDREVKVDVLETSPSEGDPSETLSPTPRRKLLSRPFEILCDFLGRKQSIRQARGPVLFYSDEIPLPHHNFDDVGGLRKFFTVGLAKSIGATGEKGNQTNDALLSKESQEKGSVQALDALGEALKRLSESAELDVDATHPVIQLLAKRKLDNNSSPGSRKDGFKLGLVVEGGGMRGSVSAGMLRGLSKLGLLSCFDAVYGSSAGALNASYFLTGQIEGVDIYTDHIANKSFINVNRLPSLRRTAAYGSIDEAREAFQYVPVLNLEFLLNHVMRLSVPLDFEGVLKSPVPLKIVSTSLDANRSVLLENFQSSKDLQMCLWSSACVPGLAGPPVHHRGHRLVDAAVFEAIPYKAAVADDCTHILALLTRRLERHEGGPLSAFSDRVLRKIILSPRYMEKAWEEVDKKRKHRPRDKHVLQTARYLPFLEAWSRPPYIYPLEPPEECDVIGPLCVEVPALRNAIEVSEAKAMRIVSRGMDLVGYEPSLQTKLLWIAKRIFFDHKADPGEVPGKSNARTTQAKSIETIGSPVA